MRFAALESLASNAAGVLHMDIAKRNILHRVESDAKVKVVFADLAMAVFREEVEPKEWKK